MSPRSPSRRHAAQCMGTDNLPNAFRDAIQRNAATVRRRSCKAASFSTSSTGSNTTCVVPSRQRRLRRYRSRPSGKRDRRSVATGGRAATIGRTFPSSPWQRAHFLLPSSSFFSSGDRLLNSRTYGPCLFYEIRNSVACPRYSMPRRTQTSAVRYRCHRGARLIEILGGGRRSPAPQSTRTSQRRALRIRRCTIG